MAAEELPAAAAPPPAPGGRVAGAPLDLGGMSNAPANATPVPRTGAGAAVTSLGQPPRATGVTAPPSQAPRDVYDLGYGYLLHKDYALAEDTFRDFMRRYPSDRLTAEAQYWLGESMFQRQNYRGAADTFLSLSKKFEFEPQGPRLAASSRPVARRAQRERARLRDLRRSRPQVPQCLAHREASGGAGTEACALLRALWHLILRSVRRTRLEGWPQSLRSVAILRDAGYAGSSG